MKALIFGLLLITSSFGQAGVKTGTPFYMGFQRAWFGKELPGNLFEVANYKAIQRHIEQVKNEETECGASTYIVSHGISSGLAWTKISESPDCEPNFDLPTVFIMSVPGTTQKYAVMGGSFQGIGVHIEKIVVDYNARGYFENVTILTTTGADGGAMFSQLSRIFLESNDKGQTKAIGFTNINLPESVEDAK